jgi:hypothetical protein
MAVQPNDLMQKIDQAQLENFQAQMDALKLNIREIKKKVEANQPISDGELDLVKQYKYAELGVKTFQNQPISDQELAFLKSYKPTSIGEDKPKEITSTGGTKESKALASLRTKPELVTEALNSMRSVLDTPLPSGETVRERFLTKVFGRIYLSGNEFGVMKNGEIVPAPKEDMLSGVGSFGGKLVTGVAGEMIGAGLGAGLGPAGVLIGAGLGAGVGEGMVGVADRAKDAFKARELGLIEDKEIPKFALTALGEAGKEAGVVAGLTSVLSTLKPIASKIAKDLRVSGTTGREISAMKGKVEQQALVDRLLEDIAPIEQMEKATPGLKVFGETGKKIVLDVKNSIIGKSNQLFDQADAQFADRLQSGDFEFIDASGVYNKLRANVNKFTREGVLSEDEAADILSSVQNQLNGTKNDILSGAIRVPDQTLNKFSKKVEKVTPVQSQILDSSGNPVTKFIKESVETAGEFDAKKVTAADYRRTSNVIDELFSRIKSKRGKKALGQLATDIENKIGSSNESLLYKRAFKEKGKLYKALPEDLIGIDKDTLGSEVQEAMVKLQPEEAVQFRRIVEKAPEREIFDKSAKKEFMNTTPIRKRRVREVRKGVGEETLQQAQARSPLEAEQLEASGVKAKLSPIKKALLSSSETTGKKESMIAGENLASRFYQKEGEIIGNLLGSENAKALKETAEKLGDAQDAAGIVTRLPSSSKFKSGDVIESAANVGEEILSSLPGGKAVSKGLSMTINPLQRGAASLIDAAPIRPAPFGTLLGEQVGLLPKDEPTEEQKKRIRLGFTKTRLLD